MTACQHVIVCEGFDDRAFWTGWLEDSGCESLYSEGSDVRDPWGRPVKGGGRFGFRTPKGGFVLLVPAQGKARVFETVQTFVRDHPTHPLGWLIANVDEDDRGCDAATDALRTALVAAGATVSGAQPFTFDGCHAAAIVWRTDDAPGTTGVPEQQTLERLVCASIVAALPARGVAVDNWLAGDPRGDIVNHKNMSLSYLAKWYATHGCDDYFKEIWRQPDVRQKLLDRLANNGSTAILDAVIQAG